MRHWFIWSLAFLSLTACLQNSNTDDLSTDEFDDLQEIVISETEASVFTLGVSETVLVVENQDITVQAAPNCRTIVAGSETDADSDNIPDDVTYQFNCNKALANNVNRSITGRIRILDTATNPSIGYQSIFINFKVTDKRFGTVLISETRNGTRGATLNADKLSVARENNIQTVLERPSRLTQTLENQMQFLFTSNGGIIQPDQPFPAGALTTNSTVTWTRGNFPSRSYTTTTPTPLQVAPSCASQRIVGGVQILTRGRLTVQIVYQACGTPPVVTKTLN